MAERYDPQWSQTTDWRTFCYDHRHDMFILPCIEGDVEMTGARLLLNLMLTQPLIKRQRPISRNRHLLLSGIYGAKVHAEVMTRISQTLEEYGYTREELGDDMIMTANNAHNMCYTHLGAHVRTMDIFAIAETMSQEKARESCVPDYGDIEDRNIKRMETAFNTQSEDVYKLLVGTELEYNIFRAPLLCNALKKDQFLQFVFSAGPRTDTDDHMFLRPVVGSFLSGMTGIIDQALESRSAAKSKHYNATQMAQTQYGNRKIHLLNSNQRFLYPGDCGSERFMLYEPNERTVERYLGKFYQGANGELIELTRERFGEVVGKAVRMRDVPLCLYTDGYCETCGGTITRSFSKTGNVGFLSNVNTGAPVAQQVLSTKHLTKTNAAEYEVPSTLEKILMSVTNNIFVRPGIRPAVLAFGFQPNDISKINDLKYKLTESELQAAYFSEIKYLSLGMLKDDGTIIPKTTRQAMKSATNTYPHLSAEILNVIRKHPEDIVIQDGLAWLLLRHVNTELPVMQCSAVNNSVRQFVKRFTDLVTKDIENYTSLNHIMRDLTRLVWEEGKVYPHITHMSTLVRSCLITNKIDFHVPVVTDPDNVMFGSLNRIIPRRSIGALFAYQNIDQATNSPISYITPKQHGIFDEYMGYTDTQERDKNWPVVTGDPVQIEPYF